MAPHGHDPIDRSRAPRLGPARTTLFPPVLQVRSTAGPDLWIVERHAVPVVQIVLAFPGAGGDAVEPGREGLAWLCGAALDEGTEGRTSAEIARAIERLGASIGTGVDWDAGYLQAGGLASDFPAILDLLAEILFEPVFPAGEIERLLRQRQAELLRRRDQPAALAGEHLVDLVYGAKHPYGRLLNGDETSLGALDRATCLDFFARRWRPSEATLIVVGDVEPSLVEEQVGRALGRAAAAVPAGAPAWSASRRPPLPEAPASDRPRLRIVHRPEAAQTELRVGHAGPPRDHPDRATLRVLNAMLGGKFTSRLNLNLRERHGFTYGAGSRFGERRGPAPFTVSAAVENEAAAAATREILAELRRLCEELPEAAEVEDAKAYLIGVFPFTLQTTGDLAQYLEDLAVFGLPPSEPDDQLRRIAAITPEDILRAARAHLRPEGAAIVAVGPAETLREKFRAEGWVDFEETGGPPVRV